MGQRKGNMTHGEFTSVAAPPGSKIELWWNTVRYDMIQNPERTDIRHDYNNKVESSFFFSLGEKWGQHSALGTNDLKFLLSFHFHPKLFKRANVSQADQWEQVRSEFSITFQIMNGRSLS